MCHLTHWHMLCQCKSVPEEWETKRVGWMREHGVRRWRDASGREIELEPPVLAASEGPGAVPNPNPSAAPGPSAKGPRGFR